MNQPCRAPKGPLLVLLVIALTIPLVADEKASNAKPSSYAPANDVAAQLESYVKQIEADLADQSEYGDDQKSRVAKDANTLIVLAQVLGNHDGDHPLKKSAAGIVAAGRELADNVDDYASAKASLESLKKSFQSPVAGEVKWEPVAELGQLMKQVPIVNNKLRSGVTGRRFDRMIDQNAGHAASLAAIAQASQFDTAYCSSKEEESTWVKICLDMRNAASEVATAVRKKDQSAAKTGLEKLVKTCDDCHHSFRD
jgi:hypothetical protein